MCQKPTPAVRRMASSVVNCSTTSAMFAFAKLDIVCRSGGGRAGESEELNKVERETSGVVNDSARWA